MTYPKFETHLTETLRKQCDKRDIEAARRDFEDVMRRTPCSAFVRMQELRRILNNLRMCWRLGQD